MSDEIKKPKGLNRAKAKGLTLGRPPKAAVQSAEDAQLPGAIGSDVKRPDTLEIGVEFKLDLRTEDLIVLKELGKGSSGEVSKVMHVATRVVMARKIIRVEAKKEVRKQIVRELQIMHDCNSPNIVSFYGAFLSDSGDVIMCMEYMDCGSLDRISKDFGPVRVDVLGKIAESVLSGLNYLYEIHRIMHRDIKPSNVLVTSRGYIKLCDFGVSGELVNSIAQTFVGTSTYMAPERIMGTSYSIKSDIWSLGLTLMELAVGRFPFDSNDTAAGDRASAGPMGILDLLQQIVHEPSPHLPKSDAFPPILDQMIQRCLLKKEEERPTPRELLDHDPFLKAAKHTPVNLEEWAVSMMERHNRKSHLAPQLSPSTQALLRGPTPPVSPPKDFNKTPTSGDIPIADENTKTSTTPVPPGITRALSADANGNMYDFGSGPDLSLRIGQKAAGGYPSPPATGIARNNQEASHVSFAPSSYGPEQGTSSHGQQTPDAGYGSYGYGGISGISQGMSNLGMGGYSSEKLAAHRPEFPPRTSSTSKVTSSSRPKENDTFNLPIRAAPPPSGPLPQPPPSGPLPPPPTGSLRSSSRRQGLNGSSSVYSYGEDQRQ